jgi:parallel beta-helix repeat protein
MIRPHSRPAPLMMTSHRSLATLSILIASPSMLLAQGSLTPPAPPGPTMKTLAQIEPRTDVQTLIGNATNQFIIGDGVFVDYSLATGCSVVNCNASSNRVTNNAGGRGIVIRDRNVVVNNLADGNGSAGILATGSFNRIENNQVGFNAVGIQVDTANARNFVAKNTARSNSGGNFVIKAGNRPAAIVVPSANAADIAGAGSGSTDGFTNVDPWAARPRRR